jgi:hypothetical protein
MAHWPADSELSSWRENGRPAASVSFTDGLNGQTTYFYHVQLTGLRPGTRYFPDQAAGETIDTRRPSVATTETVSYYGVPARDTSRGTVFLVLGGGGTNGPSNVYGTDAADGLPQAKVISERNAITGSQAAGFKRNAADSIEDAPWSAGTNAGDAYGYAIFDVDPGVRPGDTTITMKYFAIPAVSNEAGSAHDGTTTLPATPFETFVFGRGISRGHQPGNRGGRTLEGSRAG